MNDLRKIQTEGTGKRRGKVNYWANLGGSGREQAPSLEPPFPHIGNPDLEFLRNELRMVVYPPSFRVTSDLSPKFCSVP